MKRKLENNKPNYSKPNFPNPTIVKMHLQNFLRKLKPTGSFRK
jgi:hypothetical protein